MTAQAVGPQPLLQLRQRSQHEARRCQLYGKQFNGLNDGKLIATGQLKARIQATVDVTQIKQAVTAAAAGERDGKILIVPKG